MYRGKILKIFLASDTKITYICIYGNHEFDIQFDGNSQCAVGSDGFPATLGGIINSFTCIVVSEILTSKSIRVLV